jgi:G3E family GTPase
LPIPPSVAVNGPGQLDREAEAVKQAALADRLLITKTDLADATALRERLHALNPRADAADVVQGEIDPAFLTGIGLASARADAGRIGRWLGCRRRRGRLPRRVAPRHDRSITTFPLWFDRPFGWQAFTAAMELPHVAARSRTAAREGACERRGEPGPVVVQGVQHVFHPPVTLAAGRRTTGARGWCSSPGIDEPRSAVFADRDAAGADRCGQAGR